MVQLLLRLSCLLRAPFQPLPLIFWMLWLLLTCLLLRLALNGCPCRHRHWSRNLLDLVTARVTSAHILRGPCSWNPHLNSLWEPSKSWLIKFSPKRRNQQQTQADGAGKKKRA